MSAPYQSPNPRGGSHLDLFELPEELRPRVRVSQIITCALAMGVLFLLGFILWLQKAALNGPPDIVNWMGIGMAGMMIVLHYVVPDILAKNAIKAVSAQNFERPENMSSTDLLMNVFQTRHIVATAMLEGAAFLNVIGYLLSPYVGNLVAAAVLITLIVIRFPTEIGVLNWIQSQIHKVTT